MLAKDIMTTSVVTVPAEGSIADAVDLMLKHHVSALPVTGKDGQLVGLISEGDLMRRVRDEDAPRPSWWLELLGGSQQSAQDFVKTRSRHISDVMTGEVVSVEEDRPVGEIARLLGKHRIKRVPVLRDGKVVGIVSRSNLLQALASADAAALPTPSADDRELRERVAEAINEVPGASVGLMNYTVEGGKVSIWGASDGEVVDNAVRIAVENVPGVEAVEVHMGRLPAWGYAI